MKQTIHRHVFDNGLVLLAEVMTSVESAAFSLRVPAGSIHEPTDRPGLATLTCEMSLRGCGSLDSRQFISALENLGVERSEHVGDAHTSFSGATLAKSLLPALEIYVELMQRPHLPADQLEAARSMALQELQAIEDEPAQKVMLELRRRLFPDPWGRPSQGSLAGLQNTTHGDIQTFLTRCYQPQGAILGIAGNFRWPELRDRVGELFGSWQPQPQQPSPEGERGPRLTHLAHDSNQTQIALAYPSVAYGDKDYFQAWGAVGVLSGGMSSRLFTEVREKRGLCYSVHASLAALRDQGSVMCYAGTTAQRAQETLDVICAELQRLPQGIEQNELNRLKARIKSSLVMQQESSSARAGALARDWYLLGRVRPLDEVEQLVDALTHQSINAYLADNPPRDFTLVTLGSQPLEMPRGVS